MKTLTDDQANSINSAARDVGASPTSYSGRVMFGQYCLGIPVDDVRQLSRFFVALAQDDAELAGSLVLNMRTDSLGLGIIAYFPSFDSAGYWSDEDDDEDDEI